MYKATLRQILENLIYESYWVITNLPPFKCVVVFVLLCYPELSFFSRILFPLSTLALWCFICFNFLFLFLFFGFWLPYHDYRKSFLMDFRMDFKVKRLFLMFPTHIHTHPDTHVWHTYRIRRPFLHCFLVTEMFWFLRQNVLAIVSRSVSFFFCCFVSRPLINYVMH